MATTEPIAFLFPAFPNLHQTFVLSEVLGLRDRGVDIRLFSLRTPITAMQQPEGEALAAEVCYLPSPLSPSVWTANLRQLVRSPLSYFGVYGDLIAAWWADRAAGRDWRTSKIAADAPEREATWREILRGRFNRSPVLYLLKSLWLVPTAVYLGRSLETRGIRRLHAHWASYSATVALVVHWLFNIPFTFTAHAYDIYLVPRLLGVKVRQAEFVVTCAHANAGVLSALAGGDGQGKIFVNYHGTDLRRFKPTCKPRHNELPTIVTCGRLEPYKGHHILLRACALLKRPVRCVVVGDGPQRARLEQLAAKLGIAERVEFVGAVRQAALADVLSRADLFVLASVLLHFNGKRDVIPNVLAEAMAMGVPVVSTDITSIAELVVDGTSGCLVAANDADALAAAIDELLDDDVRRDRMAEAGRARVEEMFDRDANLDQLADLFLEPQMARSR